MRTGSRGGGGRTGDGGQRETIEEASAKTDLKIWPGAHILRLFLDPKYRRAVPVGSQGSLEQLRRKRIKLLEADDRDILALRFRSMRFEFIVNLAGAKKDAPDFRGGFDLRAGQDTLEGSVGAFVQRRDDFGMAEQTFWSHDHERLAPGPERLPPQAMKILCRSGRINDLEVVAGSQVKETFQSGAGVLWTLALVPVRQEQDQAAEPLPFVLGAGDELIDDRLRRIPKISVLSLPHDQAIRKIKTVAIFESKNAGFRKGAIENFNGRLLRGEVLEGRIGVPVLVIVEDPMTLAEG